jgi:hypothetical protein
LIQEKESDAATIEETIVVDRKNKRQPVELIAFLSREEDQFIWVPP